MRMMTINSIMLQHWRWLLSMNCAPHAALQEPRPYSVSFSELHRDSIVMGWRSCKHAHVLCALQQSLTHFGRCNCVLMFMFTLPAALVVSNHPTPVVQFSMEQNSKTTSQTLKCLVQPDKVLRESECYNRSVGKL